MRHLFPPSKTKMIGLNLRRGDTIKNSSGVLDLFSLPRAHAAIAYHYSFTYPCGMNAVCEHESVKSCITFLARVSFLCLKNKEGTSEIMH